MKILALDTSTDYCSVALWLDGSVETREARAGQSHSSVVLRMVDELLCEAAVKLPELDAIAYGQGPGSFTGLRIACGVVQGLAFGADVPVLGIGTLLAMAEGAKAQRVVCCVDARVHEIYHAAFRRIEHAGEWAGDTENVRRDPDVPVSHWRVVHEPSLCRPDAAPGLEGYGWLACGSGFAAYGEALRARYGDKLAAIEPDRYPHARDIAALAAPRVARGEVFDAEAAAPIYLREKVALRIDERATR